MTCNETKVCVTGPDARVDAERKTRQQAKAWGGQARVRYDRCYHDACDNIDNVNRDVLDHYMRALAGTVAHFATSTAELR